jgi:hypothetical protein
MKRTFMLLALTVFGACNSRPAEIVGEVTLSFTGAVTRDFSGPLATCGGRSSDGTLHGGFYSLRNEEFWFAVSLSGGPDRIVKLDSMKPTRINIQQQDPVGDPGVVIAADGSVVTIDLEMVNSQGVAVHVKGSITCPPLPL